MIMVNAACPECKNKVGLVNFPKIGQRVICPICSASLEVTWLFPVSLGFLEDENQAETNLDETIE